jgi:hypothetical protein
MTMARAFVAKLQKYSEEWYARKKSFFHKFIEVMAKKYTFSKAALR